MSRKAFKMVIWIMLGSLVLTTLLSGIGILFSK